MRTCCTGLNLDGPSVSRCCCPQPKLNSLLTQWAKKVTLSGPPVNRSDCYLSPARPACVQSEPSNCDPSQQKNNNKATVILNHLQVADHSPFAGSLFRFSPFALLLLVPPKHLGIACHLRQRKERTKSKGKGKADPHYHGSFYGFVTCERYHYIGRVILR